MSLVPSVSVCGVCGASGDIYWIMGHQRACSKPVGGAGAAAPLQLEADLLGLTPSPTTRSAARYAVMAGVAPAPTRRLMRTHCMTRAEEHAERGRAIDELGIIRKIGNEYYIIKNDEVFMPTMLLADVDPVHFVQKRTCITGQCVALARTSHARGVRLCEHCRTVGYRGEVKIVLSPDEIRSLRGPRAFATVKEAEAHWAMVAEMAEVLAEDARILAEAKRRIAEEARATAEAEREARIKAVMDSLRR